MISDCFSNSKYRSSDELCENIINEEVSKLARWI